MKKVLLGLIIAAIGVAAVNYTSAFNHDHHAEWATEKGLPAPSAPILYGGAGLCVLGGLLMGAARRGRASD